MGVLGVSEFSTSGQLRRVIPLSSRCQVQMEDKQVGVDPHLRVPVSLFWAGVWLPGWVSHLQNHTAVRQEKDLVPNPYSQAPYGFFSAAE